MNLHSAGENALILYLGNDTSPATSAKVQAAASIVEQLLGTDLVDLVPSYASLLIIYDPYTTDHLSVARRLHQALENLSSEIQTTGNIIELPVYYAPEAGADLEDLAKAKQLSIEEIIHIHCSIEYRVYAIGFAPGFAYLGEVDPRLAAPRLATPRQKVPRGAVAIADRQTAVYPAISPGGWNLIGSCPVRMFDPSANPTMPVSVGDRVRFVAIERDQFIALGGELT